MEKITTLITIVIFWFILGFFITFIAQDEILTYGGTLDQNYTSMSSAINQTSAEGEQNPASKWGITKTLTIMFGFSIPDGIDLPSSIIVVISFINWLLVLVAGILLYRILNPLA